MPIWAEMHHKVEDDPEAVKDFGWVRDMYSFSYSAANAGLKVQTALPPYNPFMVHLCPARAAACALRRQPLTRRIRIICLEMP